MLQGRYDSRTTGRMIDTMSELVSVKYYNLREDMSTHADLLALLIEKIRSMGTIVHDTLAIGILVASIDVQELLPTTAAMKAIADKDMKWKLVTTRFIGDAKQNFSSRSSPTQLEQAFAAVCKGQICQNPGHKIDKCYLKRMGSNCRLDISEDKLIETLAEVRQLW